MILNGTQLNCEVIDVIATLKAELGDNGIQKFAKYFDSGDDIMLCCPYHKNGQESRPSAGIRKSDGLFHCLACGETHGLDEMVANCLGYNDPIVGYRWIIRNFDAVKVEERKPIVLDLSRGIVDKIVEATKYVSEEELDKYRVYHPYMYERGLTDDVIELFDIGYDAETNCITFPVRDLQGRCLFVARRNVAYKRFDIPKGVEKPLYGYHEVAKKALESGGKYLDKVYLCEGLFDCLRLWCNGKIAVAGFGCLYNSLQMFEIDQLPTRKIVLALDNDIAGQVAAEKLKEQVKGKLITRAVIPNGHKDIGECTDEEIQNLQEVW